MTYDDGYSDDPGYFTRPTWRRVIRNPTVRRDWALSRRRVATRHYARLWKRAAMAPEQRP